MTIPDQVWILGYPYKVEVVEQVKTEEDPDSNRMLWGYQSTNNQSIQVWAKATPERQVAILLHEALHAIDEAMDINLKEKQVRRLGHGLLAFFQQNPAVLDLLNKPKGS